MIESIAKSSIYSLDSQSTLGIHREAPPFVDQSTEMEMLTTGIKALF